MEMRTSEEARENINNFVKDYISLLLEKKEIDKQIKELKENSKEDGVPVGVVCKQLNSIKADKKKTDAQAFEEETIKEWLSSNNDIDNLIGVLMAK